MDKSIVRKYISHAMRDITSLGSFPLYALLLLLTVALNLILLFYQLLFGLLFTGIVVVVIRLLYFKERPLKQEFTHLLEKIDASSFPSWHAARIVFLGILFSQFTSSSYGILGLAIVTALVIYSRVYLRKHDWLDILGGVLLGIITWWLNGVIF